MKIVFLLDVMKKERETRLVPNMARYVQKRKEKESDSTSAKNASLLRDLADGRL